MNLTIRKAIFNDSQLLTDLGAQTFYEAYSDVKFDHDLKEYIPKAFIKDEIESSLKKDEVIYLIANYDKDAVGYVKLRQDRSHPDLAAGKNLELERIYVLRQFWRHKIGAALMDEVIKIAKHDQYRCIWLGVWQENKRAIDFYKKLGFDIFGVKKFFIGSEENDDYVMQLKLF